MFYTNLLKIINQKIIAIEFKIEEKIIIQIFKINQNVFNNDIQICRKYECIIIGLFNKSP